MLQVLDADEEYLVGTRGHVLVTVWGRVNLDRVRRAMAVQRWLIEESDHDAKSFGVIGIVVPNRLAMSDSLAAEIRRLDDYMASRVLASAIVIEGEGMRSNLLRGSGKPAFLHRPTRFPEKYFGDVGEAARWLVSQLPQQPGVSPSAEDLAWDIAEARALHHHIG